MAQRRGIFQLIDSGIANPWLTRLAELFETEWSVAIASLDAGGALQRDLAQRGFPASALAARARRDLPRSVVRLRRLLRANGSTLLHSHGFNSSLVAMASVAPGAGLPWVYTHHHQPHFFEMAPIAPWKRAVIMRLDRLLAQRADAVIAPSTSVADVVRGFGVPAEKIHVVPIGFNLDAIDEAARSSMAAAREELGLEGVLSVLSVGRLSWEKNHETTLRAWVRVVERHPDAKLLIAGVGPLGAALADLAARLGLARNVTFLGFRKDVLGIMKAVTLVVHVARTESFGQSMAEALALGRPLVAARVGVTADLEDGEHFVAVPEADERALADAIIRIAEGPAAATALGARGRALARARFPIEENARRYAEIYRQVLAARR